MAAVDWERVAVRVRALIATKPSHGRDQLLREIAEIEHECELDEHDALFDSRPLPRRPGVVVEQGSGDNARHDNSAEAAANAA